MSLVYDGKAMRLPGVVLRHDRRGFEGPLIQRQRTARSCTHRHLGNHVFVEAGAYLQVSSPDLVEDIVGMKITAKAVIRVNVGTVVHLDQSMGSAVHFGLVAGGFPGGSIRTPLGLAVEDSYDVWLLKGVLRTE